jgi:PhnB protein
MNMYPYIQFGGRLAEAFSFYKEHLDAKDQVPTTCRGTPGETAGGMRGCVAALSVDTPGQAERLFAALSDGGSVRIPVAPSLFALRFGMVSDRFGVAPMVVCEAPK